MQASNNISENYPIVTVSITTDGTPISGTIQVLSINVHQSTPVVCKAKITVADDGEDFPVSSSGTFIPGKNIVIKAGYDTANLSPLFQGAIAGQSIFFDASTPPRLVVECADIPGKTPATSAQPGATPVLVLTCGEDMMELTSSIVAKPESGSSIISGSVKTQGTGAVKAGDYISLNGLGSRFSGNFKVSGVSQQIADGIWTTTINFVLPEI